MPASSSGCEHLYLDGARASAWRFSPLDLGHPSLDAGSSTIRLFQVERDDAIVAQLPDPSLWVPRPTGLLHQLPDCDVGEGDLSCDDLVMGEARPWRFPIALGRPRGRCARGRGRDRPRGVPTVRIEALNHALAGLPEDAAAIGRSSACSRRGRGWRASGSGPEPDAR
jgi:hypothetical protein